MQVALFAAVLLLVPVLEGQANDDPWVGYVRNCYTVVGQSRTCGYGLAWGQPTEDAARETAYRYCREHDPAGKCHQGSYQTFRSQCIGVAREEYHGSPSLAFTDRPMATKAETRRALRRKCQESRARSCQIELIGCANE